MFYSVSTFFDKDKRQEEPKLQDKDKRKPIWSVESEATQSKLTESSTSEGVQRWERDPLHNLITPKCEMSRPFSPITSSSCPPPLHWTSSPHQPLFRSSPTRWMSWSLLERNFPFHSSTDLLFFSSLTSCLHLFTPLVFSPQPALKPVTKKASPPPKHCYTQLLSDQAEKVPHNINATQTDVRWVQVTRMMVLMNASRTNQDPVFHLLSLILCWQVLSHFHTPSV